MADAKKVVVTLVCASEDEDEVDDIADGLRATGREVALFPGVEQKPRLIGDALDRCGELGLVVLCTSTALDGPLLRKVEGLFSARRGPNHAMVRIDLANRVSENVAAITRAYEGFVSSQGRIKRRSVGEGRKLREVVAVKEVDKVALPVVRLTPEEQLEGDTKRIELPDNPKAVELSRRRRAARERERERERITSAHSSVNEAILDDDELEVGVSQSELRRDEQRLDRLMIVLIVGAGVLAVLAALSLG